MSNNQNGSISEQDFDSLMWDIFKPQSDTQMQAVITNLDLMLFLRYLKVLTFVELSQEILGTTKIWDEFYDLAGNRKPQTTTQKLNLY